LSELPPHIVEEPLLDTLKKPPGVEGFINRETLEAIRSADPGWGAQLSSI
jgi:hypothetical protein